MKEIRDRAITGETIVIDEVKLVHCNLVDCQLVYRGGDVTWSIRRMSAVHGPSRGLP
jgi:hypothetical protein